MMKYPALISIIVFLLIFACNKKSEMGIAGHLFKFQQTNDKKFCSPDSIVSSDCDGGNFFFTEKGKIFYTYFCAGEDSISYLVGNYFIADSLVIKCSFHQKYSLAVKPKKIGAISSFEANMNSGSLKKIAPMIIRLNKIRCEKFKYSFRSNGRYRLTYVLSEPSKEYTEDYLAKFGEVNAFKGM